jgi:hypothetical protein
LFAFYSIKKHCPAELEEQPLWFNLPVRPIPLPIMEQQKVEKLSE